jgi:hypothetical protein
MRQLFIVIACLFFLTSTANSFGACLRTDDPRTTKDETSPLSVKVSTAALADLAEIGVTKDFVWDDLVRTSDPETSRCWAGPVGNSDGQILSLGVQQWNFGQNSLQPLLRKFKAMPGAGVVISQSMPTYGPKFFSDGCLRLTGPNQLSDSTSKISASCFDFLKSQYSPHQPGLESGFYQELQALFESQLMRQVQVDQFVRNISAHKHDFQTYFPDERPPSPVQVKWVIDITTQQGGLPAYTSVVDGRRIFQSLSEADKQADMLATAEWYEGACRFSDTQGVGHKHGDCDYNAPRFQAYATSGAWKEASNADITDLILLTRIKSRTAQGKAGIYQALSFERRATIALGCGMVSGTAKPCSFYPADKNKVVGSNSIPVLIAAP